MGRSNEFRTYRRPEQATVSKSVQDAMHLYANAGSNLRKHNFSFGFEDNKGQIADQAIKSAAAKKNLYEYTKASQENVSQWRQDQLTKNRVSNI